MRAKVCASKTLCNRVCMHTHACVHMCVCARVYAHSYTWGKAGRGEGVRGKKQRNSARPDCRGIAVATTGPALPRAAAQGAYLDEDEQALVPQHREHAVVVREAEEVEHDGIHHAVRQSVPADRCSGRLGQQCIWCEPTASDKTVACCVPPLPGVRELRTYATQRPTGCQATAEGGGQGREAHGAAA